MEADEFRQWTAWADDALCIIDEAWVADGQRAERIRRLVDDRQLADAVKRLNAALVKAPSDEAGPLRGLLAQLCDVQRFLAAQSPAADGPAANGRLGMADNAQLMALLQQLQQQIAPPAEIGHAVEAAVARALGPVTARLEGHEGRLDAAEDDLASFDRWARIHLQDSMENHARDVRNEVLRLVAVMVLLIGGTVLLLGETQHLLTGTGLVALWLLVASLAAGLAVLSLRNGYVWHGLEKPDG